MGLAPVLVMIDLLDVVFGGSAGIAVEFVVVGTVAADTVAAETEIADSVAADTEIVDSVFADIEIADFVFAETGIADFVVVDTGNDDFVVGETGNDDFVVADLHHIAICNALLLNEFHILGYCSCTHRCDEDVYIRSKALGSIVFDASLLEFGILGIGMCNVSMTEVLCKENTTLVDLVGCYLKNCRMLDWLHYSCHSWADYSILHCLHLCFGLRLYLGLGPCCRMSLLSNLSLLNNLDCLHKLNLYLLLQR